MTLHDHSSVAVVILPLTTDRGRPDPTVTLLDDALDQVVIVSLLSDLTDLLSPVRHSEVATFGPQTYSTSPSTHPPPPRVCVQYLYQLSYIVETPVLSTC